jgi:hypothetical protein
MTDDDKALVKRLRSGRWLGETTCGPAADRIEAQAAEIERLQDRLWKAAQEIQGYKDAFAQATEQPE